MPDSEAVTVFGVQVRVADALKGECRVRTGVELDLFEPINGQWGAVIALKHGCSYVAFVEYDLGAQSAVNSAVRDCQRWIAAAHKHLCVDRSTDCQSTV
jgi:hypothetical protein